MNADNFWIETLDIGDDDDNDWAAIHGNNFNCTLYHHFYWPSAGDQGEEKATGFSSFFKHFLEKPIFEWR